MTHCQVVWSFSFEPRPKMSSFDPVVSVNVVSAAGKGVLSQSMGSPGPESSTKLPSISKLPTVLLAHALGAAPKAVMKNSRTLKIIAFGVAFPAAMSAPRDRRFLRTEVLMVASSF